MSHTQTAPVTANRFATRPATRPAVRTAMRSLLAIAIAFATVGVVQTQESEAKPKNAPEKNSPSKVVPSQDRPASPQAQAAAQTFEADLEQARKAGAAEMFGPGWNALALESAQAANEAAKQGNAARAIQLWDLARSQIWFPNPLMPKGVARILGDPRLRVPDLVTSLAVDPKSKLLAAGLRDGTVLVWEMPSARLRFRFEGLTEDVLALTFHPTEAILCAGGKNRDILVWSLSDGKVVQKFNGHGEPVSTLAYSPDGKTLAAAGADRKIRLHKNGKEEAVKEFGGPSLLIHQIAFSPDGKWIGAASADCKAWVFRADTGEQVQDSLLFAGGNAYGVAFFQDGNSTHLAVAGSNPNQIKIIDAATAAEIRNLEAFPKPVQALQISANHKLLLAGSQDGTIRLIDPKTGQTLRNQQVDDGFRAIALAGDASWFALAGSDSTLTIKELDHQTTGRTASAGVGEIWAMALWRNHRSVAAAGSKAKLSSFDIATLETNQAIDLPGGPVSAMAGSADGRLLAVGLANGSISLLGENGELLRTGVAHAGAVTALSWNAGGTRLISASTDGQIKAWDPAALKEIRSWNFSNVMPICLSYDPVGNRVAAGFGDGLIRMIPLEGEAPAQLLGGHQGAVTGVAFDPSGNRLASCGNDQRAILWQLGAGTPVSIQLAGAKAPLSAIAFAPNGSMVAAAGADRIIRVWDTPPIDGSSFRLERLSFRGHTKWITTLAFHPSGNLLFSGSVDGEIRSWDIILRQEGPLFAGHVREVRAVAWHPESKWIATSGADGFCLLWDLSGKSPIPKRLFAGPEPINSMTWLGDTKRLAIALQNRTINVIDAEKGEVSYTDIDSRSPVEIPVLGYFKSGNDPFSVLAWVPPIILEKIPTQAGKRKESIPIKDPALGTVKCLALSPEGDIMAAGGDDGNIRFWDTQTAQKLPGGELPAQNEPVADIALSQGRKFLACSDLGGRATIWKLETREKIKQLPAPGKGLAGMAMKPNGTRLLVASADNRLSLFDMATGNEIKSWDFRDSMGENKKRIRSICFAPNENKAALGLTDGLILILDTP